MSSCAGLQKMKDGANSVKYDASPKILELKNGEVTGSISGTFPAKYFNKNAVLTITPMLKYDGGQVELDAKKLQGESVTENNQAIPFEAGGSFSLPFKFTYKDEMMLSKIQIKVSAQMKKESLEIGSYDVADGIIVTPKLVRIEPKPIYLNDNYQQVMPQVKSADIHYLINRSEIRNSEIKSMGIKELKRLY